jgi:hypothetical protein
MRASIYHQITLPHGSFDELAGKGYAEMISPENTRKREMYHDP